MLYHNIYSKSDSEDLKLQGQGLPKTLFPDFKLAIIFFFFNFYNIHNILNTVSLRLP